MFRNYVGHSLAALKIGSGVQFATIRGHFRILWSNRRVAWQLACDDFGTRFVGYLMDSSSFLKRYSFYQKLKTLSQKPKKQLLANNWVEAITHRGFEDTVTRVIDSLYLSNYVIVHFNHLSTTQSKLKLMFVRGSTEAKKSINCLEFQGLQCQKRISSHLPVVLLSEISLYTICRCRW